MILDWVDEGLDVNRFHIIGHGLGGQIAGMIGRCAFRKSEGETKLSRITALDPPAVFPLGARINEKDADLVDFIFTDAWFYSNPKNSGTLNFWASSPNRKSKSDDGKSKKQSLEPTKSCSQLRDTNIRTISLFQNRVYMDEPGNFGQKPFNLVNSPFFSPYKQRVGMNLKKVELIIRKLFRWESIVQWGSFILLFHFQLILFIYFIKTTLSLHF